MVYYFSPPYRITQFKLTQVLQARIQKFFKGGGGLRRKILKRKMLVDTRINACTHKN